MVWPGLLRNIGLVSKIEAQQKHGSITALLSVRREVCTAIWTLYYNRKLSGKS